MNTLTSLASQLEALREQGHLYLESLSLRQHPFAILDIVIVAIILYWAYKFVRGTKAASIVSGFILVGAIFAIGRIFDLDALNWLLRILIPALIVAIPVVFQPELRRILERLGRNQPWRTRFVTSRRRAASIAHELSQALNTLTENKTGALIVLTRKTGLNEDVERATRLDAQLNARLLLNIFFPNSPLHDGAVVVQGDRIAAAGVTLPLSEAVETYQLGTRHKAALGITETTDALALLASEERGTISIAFNGKLYRDLDLDLVRDVVQLTTLGATTKDITEALPNHHA